MILPAKMRAWVSDDKGEEALHLQDINLPIPGKGEVLVKVAAAALNFSDILMIRDCYQIQPPRPFTPGQEVAGYVVATGRDCFLRHGARLMGKVVWGGLAEYVLMREDMAMVVPDGFDMNEAAAIPISYTTALVALLEIGAVKKNERVLVLAAAGGVGLACLSIAVSAGAQVVAVAGGAEKCAIASHYGAHKVIDYRNKNWGQLIKEEFGTFDVIADPVGGCACDSAIRLLARDGRYLIIGFASGTIPNIAANRLLLKRARALGVYWDHDHDKDMLNRIQSQIVDFLYAGKIKPCLGKILAFEELPHAMNMLANRQTYGKVVIDLSK